MARKKPTGRIRNLFAAGAITAAFALYNGSGAAESELHYPQTGPSAPAATETVAVVFTGGPKRIHEGLRLYMDGKVDRLLVSGVHKSLTPAKLLRNEGIKPTRPLSGISLDYASQTTEQNAQATAKWLNATGKPNIVLITSAEHMPRALKNLRREITPGKTLFSMPVETTTTAWSQTRERIKTLATDFGIRGFSEPLRPI